MPRSVRQRVEVGQRRDVRALDQLDCRARRPASGAAASPCSHWSCSGRSTRGYAMPSSRQVARVGDDAGERRGRRGLRAAEADRVLLVPERPGKLRGTVRRLIATGGRRLAHADAPHAAGLVDAGAGGDQRREVALGVEVCERLARGRVDVERDPVVRLPPVDDERRDRRSRAARGSPTNRSTT